MRMRLLAAISVLTVCAFALAAAEGAWDQAALDSALEKLAALPGDAEHDAQLQAQQTIAAKPPMRSMSLPAKRTWAAMVCCA